MDDEQLIEDRILRLKKRGFTTEGVRESCQDCGQSAQRIYKTMGRGSVGRDIRWCLACGKIRSWRRVAGDQLVEDTTFDLDKFLA
jgi:hypothetical protein